MLRNLTVYLLLLPAACLQVIETGCSGSSSGALDTQALGFNFNDNKSQGNNGGDGSDETDNANPPQQVTGSFLTCAYMAPETQVVKDAGSGQPIAIGCGFFQRGMTSVVPSNIDGLTTSASIACAAAVQPLVMTAAPAGSALQLRVGIKPAQLPCTIEIAIRDQSGHSAVFGKSLPTITQADASSGFDINSDMQQQGITLNAARINTKAAAQQDGITNTAKNSALGNRLGHVIGGAIGTGILSADGHNDNGGPLFLKKSIAAINNADIFGNGSGGANAAASSDDSGGPIIVAPAPIPTPGGPIIVNPPVVYVNGEPEVATPKPQLPGKPTTKPGEPCPSVTPAPTQAPAPLPEPAPAQAPAPVQAPTPVHAPAVPTGPAGAAGAAAGSGVTAMALVGAISPTCAH